MKLDDDEFLIEIFGRKGLVLDKIGFKTTKNRQKEIGGLGGGKNLKN